MELFWLDFPTIFNYTHFIVFLITATNLVEESFLENFIEIKCKLEESLVQGRVSASEI